MKARFRNDIRAGDPGPESETQAIYLATMTREGPVEPMNSETAILSRLIGPERAVLSPDAARYLLGLEFQESDLQRMNDLAEKARDGALSLAEEREIESYRHVGHLLALLRSKARVSLSQQISPREPQ